MNRKIRPSLLLSTVVCLILMSLAAGCYREAAPDVTPTMGAEAAEVPPAESEEESPGAQATAVAATAMANSALATQAAEEAAAEEPPPPPPTATPTPEPTETPVAAATFTPVPEEEEEAEEPAATPVPEGQEVVHVVQPGENLFRIALRYNTTVGAVASANGIANPALIYVGQKLTITSSGAQPPSPPAGDTYVVQPGDNLFRIALRYNMSWVALASHNGIANPAQIYVGQVISIP
jgi:LysM repeat protein